MIERLQKYLAGAGIASRRKCEELILQGQVRVNNSVVTKLGTKVDPQKDIVEVKGKLIKYKEKKQYSYI
ncbi:pseudouridine synthase, partial [Candidatus Atribacteria bacterium HGW-Atribacteria-1]